MVDYVEKAKDLEVRALLFYKACLKVRRPLVLLIGFEYKGEEFHFIIPIEVLQQKFKYRLFWYVFPNDFYGVFRDF